ncbi:hypothetical protein A8W25_00735 [Streptomyces sp. ERV7]|uniref:hypothetical protein n=1 Tax=Streptomyces sp. ERV7 TaxID=1322334 RepID=UPI0007F3FF65|nr:hypothetical protein [Streptomyces sp. ERV7]OAR26861.1 hypothetical protein A8W25_00735 [Streptomyces sp. ERV7]
MGITDSAARLAAEADLKGRATHATHRTGTAAAGVRTAAGQAARTVRDHTPAPVRRVTAAAAMAGRARPRRLVSAVAAVAAAALVLRRRRDRRK